MDGLDEVLKNLNRLGFNIADNLESAAKAGAKVYQSGMKDRAPKDGLTLEESITIEVVDKDDDEVNLRIGPSQKAFYGRFHEDGTSKMNARPFVRPTIDEDSNAAFEATEKALRKVVASITK